MQLSYPQTILSHSAMEKLSSTKPVPCARKVGNWCKESELQDQIQIDNYWASLLNQ